MHAAYDGAPRLRWLIALCCPVEEGRWASPWPWLLLQGKHKYVLLCYPAIEWMQQVYGTARTMLHASTALSSNCSNLICCVRLVAHYTSRGPTAESSQQAAV